MTVTIGGLARKAGWRGLRSRPRHRNSLGDGIMFALDRAVVLAMLVATACFAPPVLAYTPAEQHALSLLAEARFQSPPG